MAHIRRRPLQAIPLGHPIIREKNRQLSKSIRTRLGLTALYTISKLWYLGYCIIQYLKYYSTSMHVTNP